MDPDLELLEAWRQGDKKAAGEILDRYYKLIRCTVATKVPDSDVDDNVQKVLLALHRGRERFRADASLKTYALRITRNKIADYFTERSRAGVIDVLGSSARELGVGPLSALVREEKQRMLLEALRSVPLDDQLILELFYWEKLTGPQLAQVFEASEPAIRSRLRRAKTRLREELERLAQDKQALAETMTDLDAWARKLREELESRLVHVQRK